MDLWKLLNMLRRLPISDLQDYPDFRKSEDTRNWLGAILDSSGVFAELTDTVIDDEIINGLRGILNSDELWDSIHGLLLRLIGEDMEVVTEVDKVGKKVGLNPALIMLIIQALRMLWEFLRSRK